MLFPLRASRSSVGTINHDRRGALPQNGSEKERRRKRKEKKKKKSKSKESSNKKSSTTAAIIESELSYPTIRRKKKDNKKKRKKKLETFLHLCYLRIPSSGRDGNNFRRNCSVPPPLFDSLSTSFLRRSKRIDNYHLKQPDWSSLSWPKRKKKEKKKLVIADNRIEILMAQRENERTNERTKNET